MNHKKPQQDDKETWQTKGRALIKCGRYGNAVECFDKALEINPKDGDIWNLKGVSLGILNLIH